MPKQKNPKLCKRCGEEKLVNYKGYCKDCAIQRSYESMSQLKAKKGPFYEKWRKAVLASLPDGKKKLELSVRRWAEGIKETLKEKD